MSFVVVSMVSGEFKDNLDTDFKVEELMVLVEEILTQNPPPPGRFKIITLSQQVVYNLRLATLDTPKPKTSMATAALG